MISCGIVRFCWIRGLSVLVCFWLKEDQSHIEIFEVLDF
jgi:hypothetical protein